MHCSRYFSDFFGKGSQIGTQAATGGLALDGYTWRRNLERYRCNQIIVLIAHIVTLFMNEANPFSLINATQILGIPIGEIQAEKNAVVFIVLIVLIVTGYLNEATLFSLFNVVQILYPQK